MYKPFSMINSFTATLLNVVLCLAALWAGSASATDNSVPLQHKEVASLTQLGIVPDNCNAGLKAEEDNDGDSEPHSNSSIKNNFSAASCIPANLGNIVVWQKIASKQYAIRAPPFTPHSLSQEI